MDAIFDENTMTNNGHTVKWIGIIVSILVVLSSLGITFARSNAKKIAEHDTSLAVIENELQHLNRKMDEVLEKLD